MRLRRRGGRHGDGIVSPAKPEHPLFEGARGSWDQYELVDCRASDFAHSPLKLGLWLFIAFNMRLVGEATLGEWDVRCI